MRIASSSSSRSGSGSNGRGRGGGRGGLTGRGRLSDRGSFRPGLRSNKRCLLNLSSETSDINQEEQEQDILDQDSNRVAEEIEVDEGEKEDLVEEGLYERGPTLLPLPPREEDKVVLTPVGDR